MNRIAYYRKLKKLSQAKLGDMIGAAQNTVCNWENGNREPDQDAYKKLSECLEASIPDLMGIETEELPEELVILNRAGKNMSPENRKKLLEMAKVMFKEDFDD